MTYNHFLPDTNFFIDYPNFIKYLFDTKPHTVVICRAVIRELDGLKKSDVGSTKDERGKGFRVREASRTIEAIQRGRLQLPNNGKLLIYTKRGSSYDVSFDEEIEATARRYVGERNQNEKVVLLSSDRNLRILLRSTKSLIVADPSDWETTKAKEQNYERRVEQAAQKDERVRLAHTQRLSLEKKLGKYQDQETNNNTNQLLGRLAKAQQRERLELEGFEQEQQTLKAEKELQTQLANRNKYTVNLSDLRYGSGYKVLPIRQEDWTQIGEIIVQKYFTYIHYPDRISTIHLSAQIAGKAFPLIIISASRQQLYPVNRTTYFLNLQEHKKVCFEAGEWKIDIIVDDLKVTSGPISLPNGMIGQFPIFETLSLKVEAVELTAEEREEAKRLEAERVKKERWKEKRKRILIFCAIMAGISVFLAPVLCLLILAVLSHQ
jgi:rRNA-processing protein FCF1